MSERIDLEARYCAHNYHPLPVVLTRADGAYVWDESGKKYLDMMSAYSAVSHGHGHERLVETHETVVRLAPPLIIGKAEIDWAVIQIREVLAEIDKLRLAS